MTALAYAFGEAVRSMWRRRGASVMAIVTAGASLFVLGLLLLVGASVAGLLDRWSAAAELSVYLADGASPTERAAIERAVAASGLSAGISYVPADEALRRFVACEGHRPTVRHGVRSLRTSRQLESNLRSTTSRSTPSLPWPRPA